MSEISSYAVSRPNGYGLKLTKSPNDTEIDGHAQTTHGIVRCLSTDYTNPQDLKRYRWTTLCIILDGRCYHQRINKFFTKRGLVTVAQRFADQAAEGADHG